MNKILIVCAIVLLPLAAEAYPRCPYPTHMWRPSLGMCMLKSSYPSRVHHRLPIQMRAAPLRLPSPLPGPVIIVPLPRDPLTKPVRNWQLIKPDVDEYGAQEKEHQAAGRPQG